MVITLTDSLQVALAVLDADALAPIAAHWSHAELGATSARATCGNS